MLNAFPSQTIKFHQRKMEFFWLLFIVYSFKITVSRKNFIFPGSPMVCFKISKPPRETADLIWCAPPLRPFMRCVTNVSITSPKCRWPRRSWSSPHSASWSPSQLAPFCTACTRFVSQSWRGRVARLLDQPGTFVGRQRRGCSEEDGSGGGWDRSRRRAA